MRATNAYSAPTDPLAVFNGPTFKGREEKRGGKRRGEGIPLILGVYGVWIHGWRKEGWKGVRGKQGWEGCPSTSFFTGRNIWLHI